ncbi:hypothetical protein QQ045_027764 [Rhodiola kirilowii]
MVVALQKANFKLLMHDQHHMQGQRFSFFFVDLTVEGLKPCHFTKLRARARLFPSEHSQHHVACHLWRGFGLFKGVELRVPISWHLLIAWFKNLNQRHLKTRMIAAGVTATMVELWKARNSIIFRGRFYTG